MENFEQGDDQISVEMTTRENGIRYRIRLEEGFVRILGLGFLDGLGILEQLRILEEKYS